jgi:FixJ family two-component response regulator
MTEVATVFIVDDDPAARESVSAVVESKGLRAVQFASAEQFLADFRGERHACLLVDVRMTGMSGIELQEQLLANGKQIPTILVTGYGNIPMAVQAMQNGAVTFLEKPCSQDALWHSIEQALQQAQDLQHHQDRKEELRERFARLSKSERDVLQRVIEGQPNKRIATELDIGLRTVELRRSQIMKKTSANSLSELIRMAIEVGFPDDVPPPTTHDGNEEL